MEQHAVPQEISSYQFHLVGDMTLKQFLELAGGVLVGVLIYALPIIGIIKWPLILISAGIGAALAFIPFEERPLEQWVFAFFHSIYSPTVFNWDNSVKEEIFGPESAEQAVPGAPQTGKIVYPNKLEEAEVSFLSKVSKLFTPNLTTVEVAPAPQPSTALQTQTIPITPTTPLTQAPASPFASSPIRADAIPVTKTEMPMGVPTSPSVYVPHNTATTYVHPTIAEVTTEPAKPIETAQVSQTMTTRQQTAAAPAQFSQAAAGPSLPQIANTVTGQILDSSGKIIEGVILEIRDEAGRPVRALKSNMAGHFIIVTPLANGKYHLIGEKEGFTFDPVGFEATGGIIQPIIIHAK